MDDITNRIKVLRTEKGLTQEDLADKLKMSRPGYQKLEKRGYSASIIDLKKIAEALDVDFLDLLGIANNDSRKLKSLEQKINENEFNAKTARQAYEFLEKKEQEQFSFILNLYIQNMSILMLESGLGALSYVNVQTSETISTFKFDSKNSINFTSKDLRRTINSVPNGCIVDISFPNKELERFMDKIFNNFFSENSEFVVSSVKEIMSYGWLSHLYKKIHKCYQEHQKAKIREIESYMESI